MKTIDVIIPTYKPTGKLVRIIEMLEKQTYSVNKIIIINTEKEYFDDFFKDKDILDSYDNILVKHIKREEFDHGATRKMAVTMSDSDYFVCMTDDAVVLDEVLIENLLKPLLEGKAAVSYARQCTKKSASLIERYVRHYNYPQKSSLKTVSDIERLGIKAYFCSDVCAAYDRSIYDSLGGFVDRTIFNEDMIMASKVIKAGYGIYYASQAKVLHYHNYTCMQQLRRNFDLGVSQAMHPEVFKGVPSEGEGVRMIKNCASFLIKKHKGYLIPELVINSGFKFVGYRLGKAYKLLPKKVILMLTMNKSFWK